MKKLIIAFLAFLCAGTGLKAQTNEVSRPKLVVGIVVDQMRWDYLYRFYPRFTEGGFKRLMNEGFSCDNTMLDYIPTVTAIGHSSVYTGSVPSIHGIAGNNFYKDGKEVAKGGLLGLFIGLAIIAPGVSGSTVAIIFKLYDKLIYAFGNVLKRFVACVKFLLPIVIGALAGFLLGFFAIQKLMEVAPFAVIGLFGGMMIGAFPAVADEIKGAKKSAPRIALFLIGLAVPIAISVATTFASEGARPIEGLQWYHYLVFVLFGYFSSIMNSVHLSYWKQNPMILLVYVCMVLGFAIGLVSFSKLLDVIFARARTTAFFAIVGLSLGSVVTIFFNSDVYAVYTDWAQNGVDVLDLVLGIVLLAVGLAVAYLFVRYERKKHLNELPKQL